MHTRGADDIRGWADDGPTGFGPQATSSTKVHSSPVDVVSVDKKGRVTIPKPHREALGLAEEDQLSLLVEGGEIRLRPVARKQMTVRARRKWGREAFLKSGEATFGDEE